MPAQNLVTQFVELNGGANPVFTALVTRMALELNDNDPLQADEKATEFLKSLNQMIVAHKAPEPPPKFLMYTNNKALENKKLELASDKIKNSNEQPIASDIAPGSRRPASTLGG